MNARIEEAATTDKTQKEPPQMGEPQKGLMLVTFIVGVLCLISVLIKFDIYNLSLGLACWVIFGVSVYVHRRKVAESSGGEVIDGNVR